MSLLRLNTISNVNDPGESKVLWDYVAGDIALDDASNNAKPDHAFISCFTFNHDSLNQFRLYGKAAGIEATGISLVLRETFFSDETLDGSISSEIAAFNPAFLSNAEQQNKDKTSSVTIAYSDANQRNGDKISSAIAAQPLYRCIYLDPKTGYLHLAQREKVTFFRAENSAEAANAAHRKYTDDITKKEKAVEEELKKIKAACDALQTILENESPTSEERQRIREVLYLSLLPLRYLVKHAAFQEEQECRMLYITTLDDPAVQMDFDRQALFVAYKPKVAASLDRVYIGPAATASQHVVAKLLKDQVPGKKVRVKLSENPYRNPSSHG